MRSGTAILIAGLLGSAPSLPAPALARPKEGPSLPQALVLTNLRSVTGRTIYLLLRPGSASAADRLRPDAEALAAIVSARLRLRPAGSLWVAVLEHERQALDVHRQGRHLRVALAAESAPGTKGWRDQIDEALSAGIRLRPDRLDSDLDQEILLQARSVMRDREQVPARLVALAQAAAARQLLLRYVAEDDVGAALWGRRDLPLLAQHPDAALLKEVATFAWESLTVPVPRPGPLLSAPPPPQPHAEALAAAAATAERARRVLRSPEPVAAPGPHGPEGSRAARPGNEARGGGMQKKEEE